MSFSRIVAVTAVVFLVGGLLGAGLTFVSIPTKGPGAAALAGPALPGDSAAIPASGEVPEGTPAAAQTPPAASTEPVATGSPAATGTATPSAPETATTVTATPAPRSASTR